MRLARGGDARRQRRHITVAPVPTSVPAREFVANPRGIDDAALIPGHYGDVAVPVPRDALQRQEIPRSMCIETIFVTTAWLGVSHDIKGRS